MKSTIVFVLAALSFAVSLSAQASVPTSVHYSWNGPEVYELEFKVGDETIVYGMDNFLNPGHWREKITISSPALRARRFPDPNFPNGVYGLPDGFTVKGDQWFETEPGSVYGSVPVRYLEYIKTARQLARVRWLNVPIPK